MSTCQRSRRWKKRWVSSVEYVARGDRDTDDVSVGPLLQESLPEGCLTELAHESTTMAAAGRLGLFFLRTASLSRIVTPTVVTQAD